ncbi:autotransporter outer membrane beta-barrel domain-containing protein [Mannheimia indoligenes]|uniref:autotransporter outer membrane beta-barrel domain-containing protein n=1 Tax=Mannheimia indoligenes TaxID=3103145 RepID=UPI002FE6695E
MKKHHIFKLSAISVALLGVVSQGYAAECSNLPASIEKEQNSYLKSCTVNTTLTSNFSLGQQSLLDIRDSKFRLEDSDLALSGDFSGDVIAISDSELYIKNSKITRNNIVDGDISSETIRISEGKTGVSKITLEKSMVVSTGDTSAISLTATENKDSQVTVVAKDSTLSSEDAIFGSWWSTSSQVKEYSNLDITLENSVLKAPVIVVVGISNEAYEEDGIVGDENVNISANNSKLSGSLVTILDGSGISKNNIELNNTSWFAPIAKDDGHIQHNSISNLKLDNSQVTLDGSQGFHSLTIYENLSGNGHFYLNTDLANQQSDKIVVKGEDSGNFTLGIKDSGNEPQAANGKVTLVETQTGQAQFSLKDRDYVDAGAYRYRLNKEGTNWVLANRQAESVKNNPIPPTPPAKSVTPAPTEPSQPIAQPKPVAPTPPVVVQPTQPSQPVVVPVLKALSEKTNALVSLRQAQGILLNQNLQGIHQRLGELKTDKSSNVWVKNSNSRSEAKAQNVAVDSRSSGFEMDSHSLQIGADRAVNDNLRLGGFVGTSRADVDFNGEYGKGKLRSQAVGLYATFANEQGWYLDNLSKYERLTTKFVDEKRKYNAFSLSSEIGKRFALSNDWSITPQAQLAYHTVNGKADESRLNLFTARAGVRVAKGFVLNNGWNVQPYAEVNAIAEKANNAKVRVNQYQFDVAENKGRVQTALGLTAGNNNHRLGLEALVTSGSKFKQPLSVLANYRYQW